MWKRSWTRQHKRRRLSTRKNCLYLKQHFSTLVFTIHFPCGVHTRTLIVILTSQSYTRSTTPRLGEITAATRLSKSRRVPPRVATQSAMGSGRRPSNFSKFTDARASASALDMSPLASRAACQRWDEQLSINSIYHAYPCNIESSITSHPWL